MTPVNGRIVVIHARERTAWGNGRWHGSVFPCILFFIAREYMIRYRILIVSRLVVYEVVGTVLDQSVHKLASRCLWVGSSLQQSRTSWWEEHGGKPVSRDLPASGCRLFVLFLDLITIAILPVCVYYSQPSTARLLA